MSNRLIKWCRHHISRLIGWCTRHISRFIGWCTRHPIQANIIVLGVEVISACLIWFILGGTKDFPTLISYVIICFSVAIASIAAVSSMFASVSARDSLTLTSASLELTRESQRPFLNVEDCSPVWSHNDGNLSTVHFFVNIINTGVFPADKVSILFNVYEINDNNKKHLFTTRNPYTSILFPNDSMRNLMFEEADDKNKLTVQRGDKIKVEIEIRYENKLANRPHKTVRCYLAQDIDTSDRIIQHPEGGDDWD